MYKQEDFTFMFKLQFVEFGNQIIGFKTTFEKLTKANIKLEGILTANQVIVFLKGSLEGL